MHIRVYGDPAPQGSKTAVIRGGRAIMFEASKKLPAWRETLLMTFSAAKTDFETPVLGPLGIEIVFYLERPHSTVRKYPNTAPDIDKLLRAVFDGLQESDFISNDGQIVEVKARKIWADENVPTGCGVKLYSI